ncbi:hypothetical protein NPIL_524701 [Nephila pilipes]|uniref:Uncharacterized protein n=1 Tax=Nephila pilipes TaxID=299642 RepID=A0A8X6NED4_NEPPI|nr:hypothetical protein NPIL_524701 [Nephila pilipes]
MNHDAVITSSVHGSSDIHQITGCASYFPSHYFDVYNGSLTNPTGVSYTSDWILPLKKWSRHEKSGDPEKVDPDQQGRSLVCQMWWGYELLHCNVKVWL